MVFLSFANFAKISFDRGMQKHRFLRMSGKFYGRRRNCYTIARRAVQRALKFVTMSRKIKSDFVHSLRVTRIEAACSEHGSTYRILSENLAKCRVELNSKILTDLAIWEPRTFESLVLIAQAKHKIEAPDHMNKYLPVPDNVITRGKL